MTTKEFFNRTTKEMLKKSNAMKELSESNLAVNDTRIDIDSMCTEEHVCNYIWMLRKYGSYLIKLSKGNVYQFDLDSLKGYCCSGIKVFYHIHGGLIEQITETDAIELASECIEK